MKPIIEEAPVDNKKLLKPNQNQIEMPLIMKSNSIPAIPKPIQ